MVRSRLIALAAAVLLTLAVIPKSEHKVCDGFLPENDLSIPIGSLEDKGISQDEFNAVIDTVEALYTDVVAARGGVLQIRRLWEDNTVNAYAQRSGNNYIISMFGGLARHSAITQDGFALVVCHELGHHIGGFPKKASWYGTWASNEGQSDYFANLKCLRQVFRSKEAQAFTRPVDIMGHEDTAAATCAQTFQGADEIALCVRNSMAGMSVMNLFKELRNETTDFKFDTPDPNVVSRTADAHPATQCRLDTYFHGSLCPKPVSEDVSADAPAPGTCVRADGHTWGVRPLCWYKPPAKDAEPAPSLAKTVNETLSKPESAFSDLKSADIWAGL